MLLTDEWIKMWYIYTHNGVLLSHGNEWNSTICNNVHGPRLLQPASRVGIESGQCTVWEKETRDRSKVLQMGPGDSRPLGQEPCCLEPHHFYLVSWQAESICCAMMKSASCVPCHISHFIDSVQFSCSVVFNSLWSHGLPHARPPCPSPTPGV